MRRVLFSILLAGLAMAALFGVFQVARGQVEATAEPLEVARSETLEGAVRQILAPAGSEAAEQPEISFIDSPSATCYQPDQNINECKINWYYLAVDANPNYMITMTVQINQIGMVANVNGFFQNSMYIPYNMLGEGFKVACGSLGAGGNPYLGNAYAYTIRARDSANLRSANYGTVYCPAYTP